MSQASSARRSVARGALIALLLSTGATGAYAADPRDAEIAAMRAQLEALTKRLNALEAANAAAAMASAEAKATAEAANAEIIELKIASDATDAAVTKLAASPTVAMSNGRPTFSTTDGRFTASIRGVLQADAAMYFQDSAGPISVDLRRGAGSGDTARARDLNDGANARRARIGIEGRLFGDFQYNLLYDFGGSGAEDAGRIHEAWLQYSGFKPLQIRAGAFDPQVSLGANTSTSGSVFLERPAPAETIRGLAAGDYRMAIQALANGDLGGGDTGISAYWLAAGAVTGSTVGTINSSGSVTNQPFDEQLGFTGRAAVAAFSGANWLAHLGVNGSYVSRPADAIGPDAAGARFPVQFRDRPELRVDATRLVDSGAINADNAYTAGLEAAVQRGPFLAEGEYFRFGIDRMGSTLSNPSFKAWYAQGSWVLTGEQRVYNRAIGAFDAPRPNFPFNPAAGAWGALELGVRYSVLDLNDNEGTAGSAPAANAVRGGEQSIWTVGLNWYMNPSVRLMFDFQNVEIDRLSPNATTFVTPVGAQIGQEYQVVSTRLQLAF
ncbi:OprO/OprP family phosphate-selective porin [Caulobacter sp. NIBR2454]|uniref:OprO/OprP family phosphate-selective porin n=1 Tax=Caulobacter sp. NIBR2454 TaxID=3015996 RepID=UPI0022B707ED|nr:porin [Caulobacter sp. NIBR2454]